MLSRTAACARLGIAAPIIQGPFGGGLSSVTLAATVADAGGLGSFGAHHLPPGDIRCLVADLRQATARPFAINLWVSNADPATAGLADDEFRRRLARLKPYFDELGLPLPQARPERFGQDFDEQVEAVIEAAPPIFSFVFGVPKPEILEACRRRGIVTVGAATTVAEAKALESAGVDAVVATGFEAGGHRVSFLGKAEDCLHGTLALLPMVRDSVRLPVIAAGGIVDGRGVAAALVLGADAVQIGTAFLACEESGASAPHRQALFACEPGATQLTRIFTGRLARGIRNRLVEDLSRDPAGPAPYPVQTWLTGSFKAAAIAAGRGDLISLWASQATPLLRHRQARPLFDALVKETAEVLERGARLVQYPV